MRMMTRLMVLALLATAVAGAAPARADVACEVSGTAGTWQVKRLHVPTPRRLSLSMQITLPFHPVVGADQWRMFGGVYLLDAWDLTSYSYFFAETASETGPNTVRLTKDGQGVIDVTTPTQDLWLAGTHGAYFIEPWIGGDFYLVGFGTGAGSYKGSVGTSGVFDGTCEEVLPRPPGTIIDIDATDFQGGTQVMVPGHGMAQQAKATFYNPHASMVGGMFAYEPAPFPPAKVWIKHESASGTTPFQQYIGPVYTDPTFPGHNWTLTANYTGKSHTIGLQAVGLDLEPFF